MEEKDTLIAQLNKKAEELEKYKAKKRKQYEKEYDQASKQIADSESKIEETKKVLAFSDHQEKLRASRREEKAG